VQALLRTRQVALEKEDAEGRRRAPAELAGRGIVVRDDQRGQYWRPLPRRGTLTEADT
jgi:hypothetical protein